MCVESNTLELLGYAQTFIGTMLTLNVLCIFLDKNSNFIVNLVSFQKCKYESRLRNLCDSILKRIEDLKSTESYKSVKRIADSTGIDPDIKRRAQKSVLNTFVAFNASQIEISGFYKPLMEVETFREQVVAPTFCLGLGLLLFALDQIAALCTSLPNWYLYGISVLLLSSVIYWLVVWTAFFIHMRSIKSKIRKDNWLESKIRKILSIFNIPWCTVLTMAAGCLIYLCALEFIPWEKISSCFCKSLVNLLSLFLPLTFIGIIRIYLSRVNGKYSYAHVFGHLGAFIVYAAITAWIFNGCGMALVYKDIEWMTNPEFIRTLAWIFLLINGILLPFVGPSIANSHYYRKEKAKLQKQYQEIEDAFPIFENEFDNLCKEVGKKTLAKLSNS